MEENFLKTIHEYQKIIYKVCSIYRNSNEDQEDLFQEIVYQLWKSYPDFKGVSKISTWIYRIALNTAMAVYRKNVLPVTYYQQIPEPPDILETKTTSQNEERLFLALRTLNDSEKAIISLYLEDFSYHEIAIITGLTENHIGVRLNRIKMKLKQLQNKNYGT